MTNILSTLDRLNSQARALDKEVSTSIREVHQTMIVDLTKFLHQRGAELVYTGPEEEEYNLNVEICFGSEMMPSIPLCDFISDRESE